MLQHLPSHPIQAVVRRLLTYLTLRRPPFLFQNRLLRFMLARRLRRRCNRISRISSGIQRNKFRMCSPHTSHRCNILVHQLQERLGGLPAARECRSRRDLRIAIMAGIDRDTHARFRVPPLRPPCFALVGRDRHGPLPAFCFLSSIPSTGCGKDGTPPTSSVLLREASHHASSRSSSFSDVDSVVWLDANVSTSRGRLRES